MYKRGEQYSACLFGKTTWQWVYRQFGKAEAAEIRAELRGMVDGPYFQAVQGGKVGAGYQHWYQNDCKRLFTVVYAPSGCRMQGQLCLSSEWPRGRWKYVEGTFCVLAPPCLRARKQLKQAGYLWRRWRIACQGEGLIAELRNPDLFLRRHFLYM